MRVCILDPFFYMPGLKIVFPHWDVYTKCEDMYRLQIELILNFQSKTDWTQFETQQYDMCIIVGPLIDFVTYPNHEGLRKEFHSILAKQSFKRIGWFVLDDYDFDPNVVNKEMFPVDVFFKRNYNKKLNYEKNVVPFPLCMFIRPCVLFMALNCYARKNESPRLLKGFYGGGVYTHDDPVNGKYRDRKEIWNHMKDRVVHCQKRSYQQYIQMMRKYAIAIDIWGVGDPNGKTFEIMSNGVLWMGMCKDLEWGFDEGDSFDPDCLFTTGKEFDEKYTKLTTDVEHYNKCLARQNYIVEKYFNPQWVSQYILKHIFI